MSWVGPLRLLRGTVRAAAWSAGPRTLGTRAEAGAAEQPGLGSCAVRIGCASAFWGDTAAAVPQLVYGEKLDFLVFDYLSEVTMCLLAAAKGKSPDLGYVPDFLQTAMAPYIKDIHKKGMRVVSNAGGTNPLVCAAALDEMARKAGVDLNIAVVTGDDIMGEVELMTCENLCGGRLAELSDFGKEALQRSAITDIESGKKFPDTMRSMNVYLGARPISRALDLGADVVLTGRCVDSAVVLGPLVHAFGWKSDDFDLLAAGSLAGHLVECGAQSTGGIFTDWHLVPDWHNIGFPVLECFPDGQFVLTKPPGTGGLVSFGTVAEQLLYEIGDPQRFLLPDVTCDFSRVSITEIPGIEGGAVRVQGAKGSLPSSFYKVSACYHDGFKATALCPMGGPKATEKGRRTAKSILKRTRLMFEKAGLEDYSEVHVQILGSEETYGAQAKANLNGIFWPVVNQIWKDMWEMTGTAVTITELPERKTKLWRHGLVMKDKQIFRVRGRARPENVTLSGDLPNDHTLQRKVLEKSSSGFQYIIKRRKQWKFFREKLPQQGLEWDIVGDLGKNTFSEVTGAESACSKLKNIIALILTKVVGVNELILHVEMLCLNTELSRGKERPVFITTPETAPLPAPGLMGVVGGRPKVHFLKNTCECSLVGSKGNANSNTLVWKVTKNTRQRSPVLKPFFFLYPKQKVKVDIHLIHRGHIETFHEDLTFTPGTLASPNLPKIDDDLEDLPRGSLTYRLEDLAYTRSGDKGNSANIGIIARHPLYYPYLKKFLTAQAIEDFFQHILHKEQPEGNSVIRYELPGTYALNFVLKNCLGGGGTASLRSDPQGKALGQMVLDFQIKDVPDLKSLVAG